MDWAPMCIHFWSPAEGRTLQTGWQTVNLGMVLIIICCMAAGAGPWGEQQRRHCRSRGLAAGSTCGLRTSSHSFQHRAHQRPGSDHLHPCPQVQPPPDGLFRGTVYRMGHAASCASAGAGTG